MGCVVPRIVPKNVRLQVQLYHEGLRAGLAALPAPLLNGGATEEVHAAWATAASALGGVATMFNARTGADRDGRRIKEK